MVEKLTFFKKSKKLKKLKPYWLKTLNHGKIM